VEGSDIHGSQDEAQPPEKIMKPVTFATKEKRNRVTDYCKAKETSFSALVRKLVDKYMRENPIQVASPSGIRVIKEPDK
jgi:hypothetical protein